MPAPPLVSNLGAVVNLAIAQGTDFGPVTLTFTDSTGAPIDLTGASLAADLALPTSPGTSVASFTLAIQSPPTAGIALMSMPDSVTATLTAQNYLGDTTSGTYVWDLKLTSEGGSVSRPLFGNVTVWREVTP